MPEEVKYFSGYNGDGRSVRVRTEDGIQELPINSDTSVTVFNERNGWQTIPLKDITKYVPYIPEYY